MPADIEATGTRISEQETREIELYDEQENARKNLLNAKGGLFRGGTCGEAVSAAADVVPVIIASPPNGDVTPRLRSRNLFTAQNTQKPPRSPREGFFNA